jgi:tetratricopeptide (TPR) repeat protein
MTKVGASNDPAALFLRGEALRTQARFPEAEPYLRECLALEPSHESAAHALALVFRALTREAEAIAILEPLAARRPGDAAIQGLLAACLSTLGDQVRAMAIFEAATETSPHDATLWVSYGLSLKTVGRREEAIDAFRKAIAIVPGHGEAWYRLAELKTAPFAEEDEAALRAALRLPALDVLNRVHLLYALARAREDRGDVAEAFRLYAQGARLNRSRLPYDPAGPSARGRAVAATFTRAFFDKRGQGGAEDTAPIFIVGLPRSGSTLVEQILASHPDVEGTSELPYLPQIDRELIRRRPLAAGRHPASALNGIGRQRLGEGYLVRAALHRRAARPFFTDKNLGNFQHVALIELILPNARIIDVRRHPLASGVALFRHLLSAGWSFACGLEDIGRFYRDYVELMAHFDDVLPGRVHRVIYEDLVEDTEGEVRRLLSHCGLTFDPACLRFHETQRAVLTPSADQVRRPIFREGLDHWRQYEPWLAPLKEALGPAVENWRGEPQP